MRLALLSCVFLSCSSPGASDKRVSDSGDSRVEDSGETGHGEDTDPPDTGPDTGRDTGPDTGRDTGGGGPGPYDHLPAGLRWVRTNPLFISGLVVSMDDPPAEAVSTYFDAFGATALHTWADGLPGEVGAWQAGRGGDFSFLSWVDSAGRSVDGGAVIGGLTADAPGRIGFQVGDEPRDFDDIGEIEVGIAQVRAADPDALVVVNFGNAGSGVDLEDLLTEAINTLDLDVVSYDFYGLGYSTYERLEIHRELALARGVPYWRYIKAYQDLGQTQWPEGSDMRWDALSGVVYGYTGHTWFLYQVNPVHNLWSAFFDQGGSWSANATERFHQAAELNGELAALGKSLRHLTSTDVRYIPGVSLYAPDRTTDWSEGAGGDPYITGVEVLGGSTWEIQDISIGFFTDDDQEQYVALQNPTHAGADWPIMLEDEADFEIRFDFSGAPSHLDRSRILVLDHHNDRVQEKSLSGSGSQRTLSVNLEAGDLIFFKYATGVDFPGR